MARRIVTSGCGQGTIFSCTLDKIYQRRMDDEPLRQSTLYALLYNLAQRNEIYRQAGAVHACALCEDENILFFVEDVGRHNAADSIAGLIGLKDIKTAGKVFYTTGRLTSEIVMKLAIMGISTLVSRSGVTHMGLELARDLNITMIARAKVHGFLVYNNPHNIIYDAIPKRKAVARPGYKLLTIKKCMPFPMKIWIAKTRTRPLQFIFYVLSCPRLW